MYVIALYSPPTSLELFYLCKVIDFGVAECTLTDQNNHVISEGCNYILRQYFQKEKEKKNKVIHKFLPT